MVVLFWLDLWEIFFLPTPGFELGTSRISSPALYHCAKVTSGFHLWQFQVLNSGAEGLVVVLFWLDLWEIFFLSTPGFELGTSGSLVLHSTTVTWVWSWGPLVFTSDKVISGIELWCRGIGGGIVLIGPVRDFLFAHTRVWTGDLWISSPALYHCARCHCRYLAKVQREWSWYCFLDMWEIFFLPTPGFELGTSESTLPLTTVFW